MGKKERRSTEYRRAGERGALYKAIYEDERREEREDSCGSGLFSSWINGLVYSSSKVPTRDVSLRKCYLIVIDVADANFIILIVLGQRRLFNGYILTLGNEELRDIYIY